MTALHTALIATAGLALVVGGVALLCGPAWALITAGTALIATAILLYPTPGKAEPPP